MLDGLLPVDVSMVEHEYGIVGRALHGGHGSVHEHVHRCVHAQQGTAALPGLSVPQTCKVRRDIKTFDY